MSITYANSIKNRPIMADRAQCDAAGRDIDSTYATKAEVPSIQTIVASDGATRTITTVGNNTEVTYVLDPSKQFYVIGKQISVSFTSDEIFPVSANTPKIELCYNTYMMIDVPATKYQSKNFSTDTFYCIGQAAAETATDPSIGFPIEKIVVVLDDDSIDPSTGYQNDKLVVQLIG